MLFFISFNFKAQHCGFDHSSLFITSVKDRVSNRIIKNLKITLVDSNKVAFINKKRRPELTVYKYYNNDSIYIFHHNLKENFPKLNRKYYENGLPVSRGKYFLLVRSYFEKEKLFLKIEDLNDVYVTRYILINKKNELPLCTSLTKVWNEVKAEEDVTINVFLNKKEAE
ncbi:hypothetical protein MC378_04230 [Polaribacter sp. MSW13]|uniref:Uncharacterized protein n=2 Tax=Polaribacter marinus TaxID=2916838 RepID=A0A9X1VKV3_9FLAO|nr:hypothetical protein [Polaribacter marinus]